MRPTDATIRTPGARLIALLVTWLVVLHPVAAAASSCTARSLFAPGSCCCALAAASTPVVEESGTSCCLADEGAGSDDAVASAPAERDSAAGSSPVARDGAGPAAIPDPPACGCDVDAPLHRPLHAVATASQRDLAPLDGLACWLADGALRSSFVTSPASSHAPPGCADGPPSRCLPTRASADATTLGCARAPLQHDGVLGFLAALSIALL